MKSKRDPAPAPAAPPDRNAIRARVLVSRLRAALQSDHEALASFEEAIAGRGQGVDVLADTSPAMHGGIVTAAYLVRVPPARFRPLLRHAWLYSFHRVLSAVKDQRQSLVEMMRYAEFSIPDDLPETFTAWRGTAGRPLAEAVAGASWTLSRDFACFAALKLREGQGGPLVVRCTIRRADVVAFFNFPGTIGEREVIADHAPAGEVDGDPDDWERGAARWRAFATSEETAEDDAAHAAEMLA